ncbi:MAG: hypothetical protein H6744_01195 [Deltaproteobacteria bacterium]|nr:hypothetical protein [Deltaproteobacteria bacterium]
MRHLATLTLAGVLALAGCSEGLTTFSLPDAADRETAVGDGAGGDVTSAPDGADTGDGDALPDAEVEVVLDASPDVGEAGALDLPDIAPDAASDVEVQSDGSGTTGEVPADLRAVVAPPSWSTAPNREVRNFHMTWQRDAATTVTFQWATTDIDLAAYVPRVWVVPTSLTEGTATPQ